MYIFVLSVHEIFKRVSQDNHYFAHRVDAGIWTPPSHGCMVCVLSYYYSQLIFLSSTICISGTYVTWHLLIVIHLVPLLLFCHLGVC